MVDASVAGKQVLAWLDTGAEYHILSLDLVREANLQVQASSLVTYDIGGTVLKESVVEHPHIRVGDKGLSVDGAVAAQQFPDVMVQFGVLATISPQFLATADQDVVLDLPHHEMRGVSAGKADPNKPSSFRSLRTCTNPCSPIGYLMYLVAVDVEGVRAELILDIGSTTTNLTFQSVAAKALGERVTDTGYRMLGAGGIYTGKEVGGVKVRVGNVEKVMGLVVLPPQNDPNCPSDGQLGLDILRNCVIALTPTEARVSCPNQ